MVELICFLRESDRDELAFTARATGRQHREIHAEIGLAITAGPAWTLWWGDDVLGIAGINPAPEGGYGAIWFLGTDLADRHWQGMTRAIRRFMAMEMPAFDWVGNVVPAHMEERRRWLHHLGFDFPQIQAQHLPQGLVVFTSQVHPGPEA